MLATLLSVQRLMGEARIKEPLRATLALADGRNLFGFRWASDGCAPSLYYRQTEHDLVIVSEPLDRDRALWREVPQNCVLIARAGLPVAVETLDGTIRQAA